MAPGESLIECHRTTATRSNTGATGRRRSRCLSHPLAHRAPETSSCGACGALCCCGSVVLFLLREQSGCCGCCGCVKNKVKNQVPKHLFRTMQNVSRPIICLTGAIAIGSAFAAFALEHSISRKKLETACARSTEPCQREKKKTRAK